MTTLDLIGKTIADVTETTVPGAWGDEPATVLHFTDDTQYTFVHPSDDLE
jgi:hypothetical protein